MRSALFFRPNSLSVNRPDWRASALSTSRDDVAGETLAPALRKDVREVCPRFHLERTCAIGLAGAFPPDHEYAEGLLAEPYVRDLNRLQAAADELLFLQLARVALDVALIQTDRVLEKRNGVFTRQTFHSRIVGQLPVLCHHDDRSWCKNNRELVQGAA